MEQQITIKPRNPLIAALMSFLLPAWGQFYNGQIKKAIILFLIPLSLIILYNLALTTLRFSGLALLIISLTAFYLFSIIDAWKSAKNQTDYALKKVNTWYYYLVSACIILGVYGSFAATYKLGIKTYRISSVSMSPSLETGDVVVKNLDAYKNKPIDYGDIIVFDYKGNELTESGEWVFRVAGLPNDSIRIEDNKLYINGKECEKTFVRDTIINHIDFYECIEKLPNGHTNNIYLFNHYFKGEKQPAYKTVVPNGCYFVLGDNRDNAMDSRFIGCIKKEDITGQVVYIAYGKTCNRININLR